MACLTDCSLEVLSSEEFWQLVEILVAQLSREEEKCVCQIANIQVEKEIRKCEHHLSAS
jgi:hypothetical protein